MTGFFRGMLCNLSLSTSLQETIVEICYRRRRECHPRLNLKLLKDNLLQLIVTMNSLLDDEWFIPADRNIYDIDEAFKDLEVITWGVKTKNKLGDLIYIYLSAPDSRIGYRCIVEKINVPLDQVLGAAYWKYPSKQEISRNLINIRKIATLPMDERLTLRYLKSHSLMSAAPQGPRRLDARLSTFLQNF